MKRALAILLALVLLAAARLNAAVTLTLAPAAQEAEHGPELVFSGTLTNTSATDKVFLNDIHATFAAGAETWLVLQTNDFFANVPGILLPGETYTGPLFRVTLSAAAPPGDYTATIIVKGGADIFAGAELASADFDAIKTLLEYALDLDPKIPDPGGLPVPFLDGDYLELSYVPNSAAIDVTYAVEATTDFALWNTADVEIVPVQNPIPQNRVTVRYIHPVSLTARAFLRLSITRP